MRRVYCDKVTEDMDRAVFINKNSFTLDAGSGVFDVSETVRHIIINHLQEMDLCWKHRRDISHVRRPPKMCEDNQSCHVAGNSHQLPARPNLGPTIFI